MIINFTEIPVANSGSGLQDTFEMFARDFLQELGYIIVSGPDRGPDNQKDLIIDEVRKGLFKDTTVRYLVSCKHYALSRKSVRPEDEINIIERVERHSCQGFLGFYSTLPSSGLNDLINGISNKIENEIFDREKIESIIIDKKLENIFSRYFPTSYSEWPISKYHSGNAKLFKYFLKKEYDLYTPLFKAIFYNYDYLLLSLNQSTSFSELLELFVFDYEILSLSLVDSYSV